VVKIRSAATPEAFAGRSTLRTWLVGILKNKVIDQLRRHVREIPREMAECDADHEFDGGTGSGNSVNLGTTWGNPQDALSERQFFSKLEASLTLLPPRQAQAFVLRNWMEEDMSDICNTLGVTQTNLGVLLHRARTGLRVAFQER
jgi:RNA polymerase sigma-70 factor (ECF subfamily)